MSRTRLDLEDFGPIRKASVTLRPLTLFVGDNNTGKTWVSSLLWWLRGQKPEWVRTQRATPLWAEARTVLQSAVAEARRGTDVPLSTSQWSDFADRFSRVAQREAPRWVLGVTTTGTATWPRPSLTQAWVKDEADSVDLVLARADGGTFTRNIRSDDDLEDAVATLLLYGSGLGIEYHAATQPLPYTFASSLVLPSGRTGYLHLLAAFTDQMIAGSADEVLASLTPPQRQFLRRMANPRRMGPPASPDWADRLEEEVLHGSLVPGSPGNISFKPRSSDIEIPLQRGSSLLSELAPLLLLLRNSDFPQFLVYEEPEAHLHPRAQAAVAKTLARLVNSGVEVLVTTHSDLFVQQVNNLVKADTANDAAYGANERLHPDKVAAYEFRRAADGLTDVVELVTRPDGVPMPLFNESIDVLAAEAARLDEAAAAANSK